MKKLFFLVCILLIQFAYASECTSVTKCEAPFIYIDIKTNTLKGDLTCAPPNMPTFIITALDVFEADGKTLKTYFGAGETVCDVLGWMERVTMTTL